ncbi:MAG: hypothetical protein ACODAG_12010 [Myxococcota bacterium]
MRTARPARAAAWVAALASIAVAGCDGCRSVPASLQAEGPTPYARCLAADPPAPFEREVGRLGLTLEGGVLRVKPPSGPVRLAAVTGPAPSRAPIDDAVERLAAGRPDLMLALGNLGDSDEVLARNLRSLARAGAPVLVLAGGRDDAAAVDDAFDDLEGDAAARVIDARALSAVRLGPDELVLVSGAPNGRYARTDTACGYGEPDLETLAEEIGDPGAGVERRWLVSWASPAGWGPSGLARVDGGDPALAQLAEGVGAGRGIFAWPPSPGLGPSEAGSDRLRRAPSIGRVPFAEGEAGPARAGAVWLILGPEGPRWGGPPKQERRPSASP